MLENISLISPWPKSRPSTAAHRGKMTIVRYPPTNTTILLRSIDSALQLIYPGMRISTLKEVFNFVECADPSHQILWNIESKINPQYPNRTLGVGDFVDKQQAIFASSLYHKSITVRYSTFALIHLTIQF
jgi:hypothetical protein